MNKEIKPTKGNINLMISINELHKISKPLVESNESHQTIYLRKIGKWTYEIFEGFEKGQEFVGANLYREDIFNVLNAPLGLYSARKDKLIDDETKCRIELKKGVYAWRIDRE